MEATEIVPGVIHVSLTRSSSFNAYIVDDVLVDSGRASDGPVLLELAKRHKVTKHVVTHAHFDHVGSSSRICSELNIPAYCGAGDLADLRSGLVSEHAVPSFLYPIMNNVQRFSAVPDARPLQDGSEIGGGFVAIATPGHTPGHLSYWRESDRTLICGDVVVNMHALTMAVGIREPVKVATPNKSQNRQSIKKIAELNPRLTLFGHGPPLTDPRKLVDFAKKL